MHNSLMIEARGLAKSFGSAGGLAALGQPAERTPAGAAGQPAASLELLGRLRWAISDMRVLTWRTLARIITIPEQLLNVTVLPLIFVLLFSYVFNGAIILPGHGSYRDYVIAGILAVNMVVPLRERPSGSRSICLLA